ncbi:mechanosensitive ion channel family protein [Methylobacterium sp. WSM2598]|uniref:mechanosensitive ion channel family protein n=1 Tax=Methylobacterium sp. WSM2598 TaxID=398261 RepID=UPI0003737865|nr:mechanosensitive ion channel family protein [Methylobacterium sp. WSM2598]
MAGSGTALHVFGVTLIGVTPENGRRLLLTLAFVAVVVLLGRGLRWVAGRVGHHVRDKRTAFWLRQGVHVAVAAFLLLGVLSIWFDDPARLATALGLVTAGLAFALQQVITAVAGYVVILQGGTFNLGDRIVMGGVRGDVLALSFMQTTILEMGEPASVTSASTGPSSTWVHSRQYTGRVVTVSNAKVFDEPIYNYTREFPYIWEEMTVPIRYGADRQRAEEILLESVHKHVDRVTDLGAEDAAELQRRYDLPNAGVEPRIYLRLTNSWLEVTVRFLTRTHGVRELKSAMSREILDRFEEGGIGIATTAYELVGAPVLSVRAEPGRGPSAR